MVRGEVVLARGGRSAKGPLEHSLRQFVSRAQDGRDLSPRSNFYQFDQKTRVRAGSDLCRAQPIAFVPGEPRGCGTKQRHFRDIRGLPQRPPAGQPQWPLGVARGRGPLHGLAHGRDGRGRGYEIRNRLQERLRQSLPFAALSTFNISSKICNIRSPDSHAILSNSLDLRGGGYSAVIFASAFFQDREDVIFVHRPPRQVCEQREVAPLGVGLEVHVADGDDR